MTSLNIIIMTSFTKQDFTESSCCIRNQETISLNKKIPQMASIELFLNESPLRSFLRGECGSSGICQETSHTASTRSYSVASRCVDEDASTTEASFFDSFGAIDFDFNLDDVLDETEDCEHIERLLYSPNASPKESDRMLKALCAVDFALQWASNEDDAIGDIDSDETANERKMQSAENPPATGSSRASNFRQLNILDTVDPEELDEKEFEAGTFTSHHDSVRSLDDAYAKLHQCMELTAMTRDRVRQFSQSRVSLSMTRMNPPFDSSTNLYSPLRGSIPSLMYSKRDQHNNISSKSQSTIPNVSSRRSRNIVKYKTTHKTKTPLRVDARRMASPYVTGGRPVNWELI